MMDVGARTTKEVTRVSHGMARTELRLFTGSGHPLLAQEIAEFLCVPMGQARLHRFADTEVSFQIDENIRGMDVFIVQPTSRPVDRLSPAMSSSSSSSVAIRNAPVSTGKRLGKRAAVPWGCLRSETVNLRSSARSKSMT